MKKKSFFELYILCKLTLLDLVLLIIFRKLKNVNIMISVIIPTFNREKIISKSIKSVLNQTFKNIEVLIIDDGSTDKTKEEIEKFQDSRIRYIKLKENKGGANARNVGIKIAKGQYISFQDSDDIFYPNKLEKQLNNLVNSKSNLDFCKINVIFNDSYRYFVPSKIREKRIENGNFFQELVCYGNYISTQAILVKKLLIKKYMFDPNMPRLQDYDIILRMVPKVKISYTKEVLVDLHIQNDSLQLSSNKLKKAIELLLNKKFHFNRLQEKDFLNYLNSLIKIHF